MRSENTGIIKVIEREYSHLCQKAHERIGFTNEKGECPLCKAKEQIDCLKEKINVS